jgi:hypothetical protein
MLRVATWRNGKKFWDNIKMDLVETGCEDETGVELAHVVSNGRAICKGV